MTFGNYVREKRVELGKNQREMAEYIGVTPGCLCSWERGSTTPRYPMQAYVFDLCEGVGSTRAYEMKIVFEKG